MRSPTLLPAAAVRRAGLALDFRAGGPLVYLLAPVVLPFYEGEIEIPELKRELAARGIPVRPVTTNGAQNDG